MAEFDTDAAARLSALDTSSVSDALDRLGLPGQPVGIRPLDRTIRLCGPAFTVLYVPVDPLSGGSVGDFIDDVSPGAVVVIDNSGRLDATVWGDLMTTVAARNHVGGTVIDGVSRDTNRALELQYPIFARSTFMRTGKDRVTVAGIGGPVSVAGHRVNPGDLLLGDADGIVIVPRSRSSEVADVADGIATAEDGIRAQIAAGGRLDDARRQHGYHKLQTP
jgi:regulator of RNase E activity RraA